MACFADINVSQGSAATYARCGWIFNIHSTANLPRNLPDNFFLKIGWQNYGHETVAPLFWPTLNVFCWVTLYLYRLEFCPYFSRQGVYVVSWTVKNNRAYLFHFSWLERNSRQHATHRHKRKTFIHQQRLRCFTWTITSTRVCFHKIVCNTVFSALPSVLWHCWLGVRKSIRPLKIDISQLNLQHGTKN